MPWNTTTTLNDKLKTHRLRWIGQPQYDSNELLSRIEIKIEKDQPEVQWSMNFTAGWIRVYDKRYRDRFVKLGEETGLFKRQMVLKG